MSEYQRQLLYLWQSCAIQADYFDQIKSACASIMEMKSVYQQVSDKTNVPFWVIGLIHYRESSFDFATYLQNGDPLFDRNGMPIPTTRVPKGVGPFDTWTAAASAALLDRGWDSGYHWDAANALENMEAYNGLGYKHQGLPSPYLWSFTNQYKAGKYSSDGVFDPNLVDQQSGVAAIMLALRVSGVDFKDSVLG